MTFQEARPRSACTLVRGGLRDDAMNGKGCHPTSTGRRILVSNLWADSQLVAAMVVLAPTSLTC